MSNHFRPRRGTVEAARAKLTGNNILEKGEMFFELPTATSANGNKSTIGEGKIMVGDGQHTYSQLQDLNGYFINLDGYLKLDQAFNTSTAHYNDNINHCYQTINGAASLPDKMSATARAIELLNNASTTHISSINSGTANGTIQYFINGSTIPNSVKVKGLGSAAYKNADAFALSNHTHSYDEINSKPTGLKTEGNKVFLNVNNSTYGDGITVPYATNAVNINSSTSSTATNNDRIVNGSMKFIKTNISKNIPPNVILDLIDTDNVNLLIPRFTSGFIIIPKIGLISYSKGENNSFITSRYNSDKIIIDSGYGSHGATPYIYIQNLTDSSIDTGPISVIYY